MAVTIQNQQQPRLINNTENNSIISSGKNETKVVDINHKLSLPINIEDVIQASQLDISNTKPQLNSLINKNNNQLIKQKMWDCTDVTSLINGLRVMQEIPFSKIEKQLNKIIENDRSSNDKIFPTGVLLNESEKQTFSQFIIPLLYMGVDLNDVASKVNANNIQAIEESPSFSGDHHFTGLISTNILAELSNLLSKLRTLLDISDRQIEAQFLQLKTSMVEQSAKTVVDEGKAGFHGALLGFVVAFSITLAGGLLQSKNLQKQNILMKDQRISPSDHYHELLNQLRGKSTIIDSGTRLSDNFSQIFISGNQINVKSLEAKKITQQDVADTARTIAGDKDKQVDILLDLIKKMFEILHGIVEGQQKTLQTIAMRG